MAELAMLTMDIALVDGALSVEPNPATYDDGY